MCAVILRNKCYYSRNRLPPETRCPSRPLTAQITMRKRYVWHSTTVILRTAAVNCLIHLEWQPQLLEVTPRWCTACRHI